MPALVKATARNPSETQIPAVDGLQRWSIRWFHTIIPGAYSSKVFSVYCNYYRFNYSAVHLLLQFQNPPCHIQKRFLLCPIFHPQNLVRLSRIRLKHQRFLSRIFRRTFSNLRNLFSDVDCHRVSKSLSPTNEKTFVCCCRGRESFDMRIRQITNVNLLSDSNRWGTDT